MGSGAMWAMESTTTQTKVWTPFWFCVFRNLESISPTFHTKKYSSRDAIAFFLREPHSIALLISTWLGKLRLFHKNLNEQ